MSDPGLAPWKGKARSRHADCLAHLQVVCIMNLWQQSVRKGKQSSLESRAFHLLPPASASSHFSAFTPLSPPPLFSANVFPFTKSHFWYPMLLINVRVVFSKQKLGTTTKRKMTNTYLDDLWGFDTCPLPSYTPTKPHWRNLSSSRLRPFMEFLKGRMVLLL